MISIVAGQSEYKTLLGVNTGRGKALTASNHHTAMILFGGVLVLEHPTQPLYRSKKYAGVIAKCADVSVFTQWLRKMPQKYALFQLRRYASFPLISMAAELVAAEARLLLRERQE